MIPVFMKAGAFGVREPAEVKDALPEIIALAAGKHGITKDEPLYFEVSDAINTAVRMVATQILMHPSSYTQGNQLRDLADGTLPAVPAAEPAPITEEAA